MPPESFIGLYGYAAIFIGTFLEGETILVAAGFAAHRGYLHLTGVILSAFLGTLFGDQLYFYLGRYKGTDYLGKKPRWQKASTRVFSMIKNHRVLLILSFRFLYGLRTVTPFLLGAGKVPPLQYLVLNVAGAAVWAITIGWLGYLFGNSVEIILRDISHYESGIFILITAAGLCAWLLYFRHTGKQHGQSSD
jgi:membrane protein DedA with SNARE-associated domain